MVFTHSFRIDGAVMPYSQALFFAGFEYLNLTDIYIGAIFLASSGAIMDLAMDVAAGMKEVITQRPDIPRMELMFSGFRIGRLVVGTMTTTLLLAYSGGYLTMIMTFAAEGAGPIDFLNYPYVASEVAKTLVGSIGLLLVAPFTALLGALLLHPGVNQPVKTHRVGGKIERFSISRPLTPPYVRFRIRRFQSERFCSSSRFTWSLS